MIQLEEAKYQVMLQRIDGLGAVLLQEHDGNWLPVAFILRAMTSAEKNYAQIDKEFLGLVFACEKFHE